MSLIICYRLLLLLIIIIIIIIIITTTIIIIIVTIIIIIIIIIILIISIIIIIIIIIIIMIIVHPAFLASVFSLQGLHRPDKPKKLRHKLRKATSQHQHLLFELVEWDQASSAVHLWDSYVHTCVLIIYFPRLSVLSHPEYFFTVALCESYLADGISFRSLSLSDFNELICETVEYSEPRHRFFSGLFEGRKGESVHDCF